MFRVNAGRNIHEKRSEGKQAPKSWLKMRYDSFEIVRLTLNDFATSFRDQKVEGNQVSLEDSREPRFWENLKSFFVREFERVIVNSRKFRLIISSSSFERCSIAQWSERM